VLIAIGRWDGSAGGRCCGSPKSTSGPQCACRSAGLRACREALQHIAERLFPRYSAAGGRARLRAANSAAAASSCAVCGIGCDPRLASLALIGTVADLVILHRLVVPMLANAIVLVSGYLAVASLAWGFADASMDQPIDLAPSTKHHLAAAFGASRIFRPSRGR